MEGGDDHIPSEPVFVPRPAAAAAAAAEDMAEDDGVVLALVNVESDDSSYCVVLDGATFDELARVQTPFVINHGLHSVFIPAADGPADETRIVARY